jgi:succinate dehydrogenase / fumarate reductase cytochrome b subunit
VLNFAGNRAARPQRYAMRKWAGGSSRKSLSSTTMIVSGIVLVGFVVLHLATFKYGPNYASPEPGVRDLYRLLLEVFHSPGYVVFYVVCMLIIGMHLRHGISSALQSLGMLPDAAARAFLLAGVVLAVAIAGGFALIPVWVYLAL